MTSLKISTTSAIDETFDTSTLRSRVKSNQIKSSPTKSATDLSLKSSPSKNKQAFWCYYLDKFNVFFGTDNNNNDQTVRWWMSFLVITFFAFSTRLFKIHQPNHVWYL